MTFAAGLVLLYVHEAERPESHDAGLPDRQRRAAVLRMPGRPRCVPTGREGVPGLHRRSDTISLFPGKPFSTVEGP